MKYHDYHLSEYIVSERGRKLQLNLVYGYEGQEADGKRPEIDLCY